MSTHRIGQLEVCHREMFGDLVLTRQTPPRGRPPEKIVEVMTYPVEYRRTCSVDSMLKKTSILENERRRASALVDELLTDIYYNIHNGTTDYNSATSGKSHKNSWVEVVNLQEKDTTELSSIISCLQTHVERMGSVLVRRLKRRDALRRQQEAYCDVITERLAKRDPEGIADMRFTIQPAPGESGFSQWAAAMKMVAQLPGGIPSEFRRRLWLTLAERHLASRGVDWPLVERDCFSEWSHPADAELGVQIVKDLHRTGCSLFCGEDGQENQALLKRVLLAYARWNKAVGYCQGFNMLAALILQVTDKCESDALKLMIYLIEGVLPDSYFADSLRGLSVDMAVFRELLRSRLPRLSKHLDALQNAAKDGSRSYEPPLTNVFTMQWFLTLFCNCLPQPTVLRVWDLILLEGNEILLRTALAIWQVLAERILGVRSADEFYCIMGVLTRELLEFGLIDGNTLIKAVIAIGPLTELKTLREHYLYNINPWGPSLPQAVVEKQLKLYSRQSIALDISALKKQYSKLKQRQRQAHIIISAAISRQSPPSAPVTMNHLLLGKSALVPAKKLGPPKGAIPPARQTPSTLLWKDAPKQSSSSSSSDTELCDDDSGGSSNEEEPNRKSQNEDNLPITSDNNILMTTDNTSAKTSASETEVQLDVEIKYEVSSSQSLHTENPEISEISDTFDTGSNKASESDDENFDFERFLSERVKCLKEDNIIQEDESDERLNYARRNSSKALQIIQENSLILHRILQCQSRLSPSPPPVEEDESQAVLSSHYYDLDLLQEQPQSHSELSYVTSPNLSHESRSEIDTTTYPDRLSQILLRKNKDEMKSPEYGSQYTSILEKSKSLDEKYHALILNNPALKQSASEQRSITKICEEKSKFNNATLPLDETLTLGGFSKISNILDENRSTSENYNATTTQSNNSISETINLSSESTSSEQFNLTTHVAEKSYFHSERNDDSATEFLTTDFSNDEQYNNLKDFSYSFPSDNNKDDNKTFYLTPSSWKGKSDVLSPSCTPSILSTDSGIDFIKSFSFSKYSSTDERPVEFSYNGNGETEVTDSFSSHQDENSGEHSSFYRDIMSELRKYPLEDSRENSRDNLSLSSRLEDVLKEGPSTSQSQFNILKPQSELAESSSYSTKFSIESPDETNKKYLTLNVTSPGQSSDTKSPLKSPLKSPSKAFNPFPVPLSSRQSKEVPLKLGLYKK